MPQTHSQLIFEVELWNNENYNPQLQRYGALKSDKYLGEMVLYNRRGYEKHKKNQDACK